jgi:uncharacterized protein YecE (DUF72 family)
MVYIGCSGYHYKVWKGKFYPPEMKNKDFLSFYSEKFNSVEINNTFYRLPEKNIFRLWAEQTPSDFAFTIKGSRYITHMKKLNSDRGMKEAVKNFFDNSEALDDKLKCVLWQLPANLHRDDDKLQEFCRLLPSYPYNCFEFRHPSWLANEVLEFIENSGMGFCIVSSPVPELHKVSFGQRISYFRFHGEKKDKWYDYNYGKDELESWSQLIKKSNSENIFAYFNNDISANAPDNAMQLKGILGDFKSSE